MHRKLILTVMLLLAASLLFSADLPEDSVSAKIDDLKRAAQTATTADAKVSAYSQLASLQEQLGFYPEAQNSWSLAANYSAAASKAQGNATNAQESLLLGAVRCALSSGDTATADYIMSTSFMQDVSTETRAYVKLYAIWSWLCKVSSQDELAQPVAVLQNALQQSSMQGVRPVLLLTLWYLTGDQTYAATLQAEYPSSPENAVANGGAVIMPAPFWYFVPATRPLQAASTTPAEGYTADVAAGSAAASGVGAANQSGSGTTSAGGATAAGSVAGSGAGAGGAGTGAASGSSAGSAAAAGGAAGSGAGAGGAGTGAGSGSSAGSAAGSAGSSSGNTAAGGAGSAERETPIYQQLGFFRERANAQDLVDRVAKSGFTAEIREEKRASGTVYYAVVVQENAAGTLGQQLKNAGYECYPLY